MKLLLDTHLLLWAAGKPGRLSADARRLMKDAGNELIFSAASLWEIVIKRAWPRRFPGGSPIVSARIAG
jgi:PIN domain nuclease of toxin-antitoxin system